VEAGGARASGGRSPGRWLLVWWGGQGAHRAAAATLYRCRGRGEAGSRRRCGADARFRGTVAGEGGVRSRTATGWGGACNPVSRSSLSSRPEARARHSLRGVRARLRRAGPGERGGWFGAVVQELLESRPRHSTDVVAAARPGVDLVRGAQESGGPGDGGGHVAGCGRASGCAGRDLLRSEHDLGERGPARRAGEAVAARAAQLGLGQGKPDRLLRLPIGGPAP
jgi:hypothetical protein